MYGLGFKHIDKDNFMVIDGGHEVKNLRVKLLKADMQKALRERGMDDSGKKSEVLARFIRLTETVPKYRGVITQRKAKFIPLEEAIPDKIIKKTKITPYIRLEEATPDKIIKKTIANEPYQTMYNEERNKIRNAVSQPKAKPKPPPAVRPRAEPEPTPAPKAETNLEAKPEKKGITEDQFIEEFNTPWASTALSQWNKNAYEALEKLIEKTLKKNGVIDIDLLLSKGVQIPISTVKKIVMKYGLIETLVYTYDLLKSINSDIQPIYAPEINIDFNKSRTFKALKLNKEEKKILYNEPASQPKTKPKPPPERKGKGFFKHLEKDYFRVEEQGIKDIKNVKVKVLKADMQKAIKDSGLPLSSTGKKDEVTKNFIRLINAQTYPRSAFKHKYLKTEI